MKRSATRVRATPSLVVRLDKDSKACLAHAARLRGISVSDYVREVTVAQARREIRASEERTIVLTPDEQFAFWQALSEPARLTASQRRLGAIMRGEG